MVRGEQRERLPRANGQPLAFGDLPVGRVGTRSSRAVSRYSGTLRSRRLLSTTLTLLIAIAALAMIGESNHPVNG